MLEYAGWICCLAVAPMGSFFLQGIASSVLKGPLF